MNFGATLRLLRLQSGLGLRDLARRLGVSSTYLSRVESGIDPAPTPARLVTLAHELGVPAPTLIEIARRVSPLYTDYVERVPEAGSFFVDVALRKLDAAQLAEVRAFIESRFPQRRTEHLTPPRRALAELLEEDRVILGLRCASMTDALQIAAGRLTSSSGHDPVNLGASLDARFQDVPGGIGDGVAVVCVAVPGLEESAAVITFATPLDVPTPDDKPLRILVVVVGPKGASRFSPYVAELARLTDRGLVDKLLRADCAAQVMTQLAILTTIR